MKKFQSITLGLAICLLSILPQMAKAEIDNSETKIGFDMQEYNENAFIELPLISYDSDQEEFEPFRGVNPNLALIENAISGIFYPYFHKYWYEGEENQDFYIATYPFDDGDLIQIVITADITPKNGDDKIREVGAYAFRRSDNHYIDLDEVLEMEGLAYEDYINQAVAGIEKMGFIVATIYTGGAFMDNSTNPPTNTYFLNGTFDKGDGKLQTEIFAFTPKTGKLDIIPPYSYPELINKKDILSREPLLHYEREQYIK